MRLTSLLILIGIVAMMFVGQSIYQSDLEYGKERDIYNFTESHIKWNSSIADKISDNVDKGTDLVEYDINIKRFGNILGKFVDFIGYSFTQLLSWGIEYGYNHPKYDLGFFLQFLIKVLWIVVILACIPIIIPLIALVYLLFKGIIIIAKKIIRWGKKKNEKG